MTTVPDNHARRGIALFDLDGTLLAWDCQLLFRDFVVRREPWRRVFLFFFLLCAPLAPLLGKARLKRVFLAFLWRMPDDKLAGCFRDFADSVIPLIYPQAREWIQFHRAAGDLLVLTSASPEGYVSEIGQRLGFDLCLGTVVRHGPLFPPLKNHKGAVKVDRLRTILPEDCFLNGRIESSHGYTDSTADLPMLAVCEKATVVNPKAGLETIARDHGWRIVRPARPWNGRFDHAVRSLGLLLGMGNDPAGRSLTDQSRKNPS